MNFDKFSIDKTRYDLSTYRGRFIYFLELTDPRFLLYSKKQILDAKTVLDSYRETGLICKSDSYMWLQRRIYESAVHPVTQEIIPPLFRVSAIAPINIPIVFSMLTLPASNVPGTIFLHFINQSYNSACNYSNRSGQSQSFNQSLTAYLLAVSSACGFAYGLGQISSFKRYGFIIPLVSTSVANVSNIGFTRLNELTVGAALYDDEKNMVGLSKIAGFIGLYQTALTRCIAVPFACLVLPPIIMKGLKSAHLFPQSKNLALLLELSIIYASLQAALPAALAIYPQSYRISVNKLEPQFQNLVDSRGNHIVSLIGNKGL